MRARLFCSTPARKTVARTALFALLAAGATTLGLAAPAHATDPAPTPSAMASLTPASGTLLWGMHMNPDATNAHLGLAAGTLTNQEVIENFEATMGRKMDLHRIFLKWDDDVPQTARDSVARGRTPIMSFGAYRKNSSVVRFSDIVAGVYDADIARQASQVQALGAPIYLTFNHEPEVYTQSGSALEYAAAWRYYVSKFRSLGVTNVVWNWIMTPSSFGTQYVGAGAQAYYPGNDYVDILGLDGYNWYGCAPGKPAAWRSMATIAGPFRTFGISKNKPLMLAEWGSVEDPANPTRKADWIRESAATLAAWPEVHAAAYFNTEGNCSWWLDSSPQATAAFAEISGGAFTHGRASASLGVNTDHGSAPLALSFSPGASAGAGSSNGTGLASWSLDFGDGTPALSGGVNDPIPATVAHTYEPGVFTARLEITDTGGRTATDVRSIKSVGAPLVASSETAVTGSSAELNTWTNPEGLPATLTYDWGPTTDYGSSASVAVQPLMYANKHTLPVADLSPGTKYFWRASVTSEGGTTVVERSFTTGAAPALQAKPVSNLTDTGAKLTTTITPFGSASSLRHEWRVAGASELAGSNTVSFAATTGTKWAVSYVSGLAPATTYEHRAVGTSDYGSASTDWVAFTTASPPSVENKPISAITNSSAKLSATVNAFSAAGTLTHQWRRADAPEQVFSGTPLAFEATTGTKWISTTADGLAHGTAYEYRAVAVTDYGSAASEWVAFATANAPLVENKPISAITGFGAKLTTTISPYGCASTLTHQWRRADAPEQVFSGTPLAFESTTGTKWAVSSIEGLAPGTAYEYRAVGVSDFGTTTTGWVPFTTAPAPVVENKAVSSLRSTSVTLTSTISPQGPASTLRQEWRVLGSPTLAGFMENSYPATTGTKWAVTGVTGLAPGTAYEFRATGTSANGTTTTAWVPFTTVP